MFYIVVSLLSGNMCSMTMVLFLSALTCYDLLRPMQSITVVRWKCGHSLYFGMGVFVKKLQ